MPTQTLKSVVTIILLTAVLLTVSCAKPNDTQLAEGMVDFMAKGDFASATKNFDATMKAAMSAERLGQAWSQLTAQTGAFGSRTGSREAHEAGFQIVFVTCQFQKARLDIKVVMDTSGHVSGLWFLPAQAAETPYRLPSYVRRARFQELPVYVNKGGEWQLPGTLTIPGGVGPFPAVVLVQGSGPQDRDETIGPNKPFKDIAWGLASRGIAVLRYEKRTKVYGAKMSGIHNLTTKEEVTDDALAAVDLLRHSPKIDPNQIFVLGHSLGGILIPRIGKADPHIAGLIMMAGCGTQPLEEVLLRQLTYIASLNGPITEATKHEIQTEMESMMKSVPTTYAQDLREYIPSAAKMAKSLSQPMLVLQGARDYQATTVDFNMWKDELSSRNDVTFKLYPDLNHLFMTGTGKATPADYERPGSVAQALIDDIGAWIGQRQRSADVK